MVGERLKEARSIGLHKPFQKSVLSLEIRSSCHQTWILHCTMTKPIRKLAKDTVIKVAAHLHWCFKDTIIFEQVQWQEDDNQNSSRCYPPSLAMLFPSTNCRGDKVILNPGQKEFVLGLTIGSVLHPSPY